MPWHLIISADNPVFSHRNVAALAPVMTRAAERSAARLAAGLGRGVDVFAEMVAATFEVISDVTFSDGEGFDRAAVHRAARLARDLYGAALPPEWDRRDPSDGWFRRRLLARDAWGRPTNFPLQQAFYIRSHWLRMPPAMLGRHLWTKWRKQRVKSID